MYVCMYSIVIAIVAPYKPICCNVSQPWGKLIYVYMPVVLCARQVLCACCGPGCGCSSAATPQSSTAGSRNWSDATSSAASSRWLSRTRIR